MLRKLIWKCTIIVSFLIDCCNSPPKLLCLRKLVIASWAGLKGESFLLGVLYKLKTELLISSASSWHRDFVRQQRLSNVRRYRPFHISSPNYCFIRTSSGLMREKRWWRLLSHCCRQISAYARRHRINKTWTTQSSLIEEIRSFRCETKAVSRVDLLKHLSSTYLCNFFFAFEVVRAR